MSKIEEINVRTKTTDGTNLSVKFLREIPDNLEEAFIALGNGSEDEGMKSVYNLFRSAFVVALQAPARKMLTEYWDDLPSEMKESVTSVVEGPNGTVSTAVLPSSQEEELKKYMAAWVPGQRSARTRTTHIADPVNSLMEMWDHLTPERRQEIIAAFEARQASTVAE